MTALYIVPAGTNHHLEENREESGPLLIRGPEVPYVSEKVLQIHGTNLYFICSAYNWHTIPRNYYKAIYFSRQEEGAVGSSRTSTASAFQLA